MNQDANYQNGSKCFASVSMFDCPSRYKAYIDWKAISDFIDRDLSKKKQSKLDFESYYAWGMFDHLAIAFSESIDNILKLNEVVFKIKNISDQRSYYGTRIFPDRFNLNDISMQLPLMAICFIKLKEDFLLNLHPNSNSLDCYAPLSNLINDISRQAKQKYLSNINADLKLCVILGFGWADLIIIFFSNSYKYINGFVSILRSLQFSNIRFLLSPAFPEADLNRHIIRSTCTIPGTFVVIDEDMIDISKRLKPTIDLLTTEKHVLQHEAFLWQMRIRCLPGHYDYVKSSIVEKCLNKAMLVADVNPIMGRNDIVITPIETSRTKSSSISNLNQASFFNFFFKHLSPQISNEESGVISTETAFWSNYTEEIESNIKPKGIRCTEFEIDTLDDNNNLLKTLPEHTLTALQKTYSTLDHLRYEMTADSYAILFRVTDSFVYSLKYHGNNFNELITKGDYLDAKMLQSILVDQLPNWLDNMELCFIDRFRGMYPMGETSASPILSYQGCFDKFLFVLDVLSTWIFEKFELLAKRIRGADFARVKRQDIVYPTTFVSHIGNSPSPAIMSLHMLGSGFINIPTRLMFYPEGIFYIMHEVAHSIFRQHLLLQDIDYALEQSLCDIFAITVGLRGDKALYYKLFEKFTQNTFPTSPIDLAWTESKLRQLITDVIMEIQSLIESYGFEKALANFDIIINQKIDSANLGLDWTEIARIALNDFQKRIFGDDYALKTLLEVFAAIGRGQYTSQVGTAEAEFEPMLEEIYCFLKKDDITDIDRQSFVHNIWRMAYQFAIPKLRRS